MTMEEIVHGESKNVEFKETLPDKSEKYMKTIIAFANTQGGQLIVGVNDVTREVTGVDMDSVFKIMDRITNAVSDSCTPQIVPDITFQTIEGKTIVVVYVAPGANRPYYMKSRGKEGGTYIRVAGTSRQADADKIKELEEIKKLQEDGIAKIQDWSNERYDDLYTMLLKKEMEE